MLRSPVRARIHACTSASSSSTVAMKKCLGSRLLSLGHIPGGLDIIGLNLLHAPRSVKQLGRLIRQRYGAAPQASGVAAILGAGFTQSFGIVFTPLPRLECHLPIKHIHHVPTLAEELHHLLARPRQLRPPRFRLGILFQPTASVNLIWPHPAGELSL